MKTDYRVWLKVDALLKDSKKAKIKDFWFVFKNKHPEIDFLEALYDFYASPSATPNASSGADDSIAVLDYQQDGEYIWASVLQQYGIDLVEVEHLHWHKFLALIRCLSPDTKMATIMQARAYKKSSQKYESAMTQQRSIWALPVKKDLEQAAELQKLFYNA